MKELVCCLGSQSCTKVNEDSLTWVYSKCFHCYNYYPFEELTFCIQNGAAVDALPADYILFVDENQPRQTISLEECIFLMECF